MAKIPIRRHGEAGRKDVSGQPLSQWDIENIRRLINFFEKAYPGVINQVISESRKDVISQRQRFKKHSLGNLEFTRRAAIPEGLLIALREGYPAIITDRRQFEQFLRAFPKFDLWKK